VPPPPSTGPTRANTPYSRFIPREELGQFAAWSPDTLNTELDPPGAPAGAAPGASTATADKPAVQAQVAAARQAGYQDGYRDGLSALDSFKQSFAMQMSGQLGPLLNSFNAQLDALEPQMAQAVNAVLQSARHIRVLVHPDDHALVASGAAEALQARGARLLAQPGIERGGCLVESDLGQIDARIDARWRQAAAVLGSELPWREPGAAPEAAS